MLQLSVILPVAPHSVVASIMAESSTGRFCTGRMGTPWILVMPESRKRTVSTAWQPLSIRTPPPDEGCLRVPAVAHVRHAREFDVKGQGIADDAVADEIASLADIGNVAELGGELKLNAGLRRAIDQLLSGDQVDRERLLANTGTPASTASTRETDGTTGGEQMLTAFDSFGVQSSVTVW